MEQWRAECVKQGVLDTTSKPDSARTLFNRHKVELIAGGWIACAGDLVWSTKPTET